ncbi:cellulase family glycosylhydrolase [Jatrophihabitans sp.]|uniref:glycoside hydrolase family 5 protein n=1 Tax=Jatrophihabitans sp. TaxID=1932789 RepID=UPI0030C729DF|nr:hypothetical protein [Jatrophihabitans sp.]
MDPQLRRRLTAVLLVLGVTFISAGCSSESLKHFQRKVTVPASVLRGVNVYSLEQNRAAGDPDAEVGEPESSYTYLAAQGVRVVRLAVPWGSLQPLAAGQDPHAALDEPLDKKYLAIVEKEVAKIARAGLSTVLDLHNGCGYPEGPSTPPADEIYCGPGGITLAQAERIWLRLSNAFRDDTSIAAYDLFNEPQPSKIKAQTYRQYTSVIVAALRRNGDQHQVWVESLLGQPISDLAPDGGWIADPLHRVTYSSHFYPDFHLNAHYAAIPDRNRGSFLARIVDFGQWCQAARVHCSIGELGWPGTDAQAVGTSAANFWNQVGNDAYNIADRYKLDVTYFGASSVSPSALWAFGDGTAGEHGCPEVPSISICRSFSQASVIQAHSSG